MRSYNFVFDFTHDFDDIQFRIRSIDFDQQSYEGRKNLYLPQYFKENKVFVELVSQHLNPEVIHQYQQEERSQIIRRIKSQRHRLGSLRSAIAADELAPKEKIKQLAEELSAHYNKVQFLKCTNMADLLRLHLREMIITDLKKQ